MLSRRLLLVSGILVAALGVGGTFPAIVGWLGRGGMERQGYAVLATGLALIVCGAGMIWSAIRRLRGATVSIPAPVRAVIAANVCFLAFCALETSDGLLFRGGRILYWTSVLFLPALAVLYGQVLGQPWSWWVARVLAALATLWFVGFIAVIPFADLRSDGAAVPWYGRLYMAGISLAFASISAYAFHSLGRTVSRSYFGLARSA